MNTQVLQSCPFCGQIPPAPEKLVEVMNVMVTTSKWLLRVTAESPLQKIHPLTNKDGVMIQDKRWKL